MNILVVAAHPDDEVLGCGATIARHAENGDEVSVLIFGQGGAGRPAGAPKKLADAAVQAAKILGVKRLKALAYPDQLLETYPILDLIRAIETFAVDIRPEVVYTHWSADMNRDHRVVHEACVIAFRTLPGSSVKKLLFFEVPDTQGAFVPDYFVPVENMKKKLEAIEEYESEMRPWPHPRSVDGIEVLAAIRGALCGHQAAEAFQVGRIVE
jgi:N-acetylglucosamine malate deacetylase 1